VKSFQTALQNLQKLGPFLNNKKTCYNIVKQYGPTFIAPMCNLLATGHLKTGLHTLFISGIAAISNTDNFCAQVRGKGPSSKLDELRLHRIRSKALHCLLAELWGHQEEIF
jgi:hypothetical protein